MMLDVRHHHSRISAPPWLIRYLAPINLPTDLLRLILTLSGHLHVGRRSIAYILYL